METQRPSFIQFSLNGHDYQLASRDLESRLVDVAPEVIRKHAVKVNDVWFPVVQAFQVATGIPRSAFRSNTARRHLAALGFEIVGNAEPRSSRDLEAPRVSASEGHTEANVQASLVTALAAKRWRILSVANTATKEPGIDVIASRDGQTVGVEVKGFPSRNYADPARAEERKRTSPSTQAGHWYSQAVLAAMRRRGREPSWRSAIALPDFPRFRDLHGETAGSLAAAQIEVWWVDQEGAVRGP
ncbi:conserved hypothetical protein [Beutenbergia cavernae DSM 12333]|uniref:Uncharacterized protein n=1 Tax=Beutenbergia cavernae (strain ATCC BAA-8 / DSM 12333 / CCUG 43141 / JCM 11478 / NBRC 16432 / NCIMB 13614 / HKI 0122) TaxID=471853 RepID=C5C350_BEUC1|nr:hypothetical protein [Beutenbergia cavernae]ACQ79749.1 conserved hypothetical protein [Beutenbergia cavernae DSM 12333]